VSGALGHQGFFGLDFGSFPSRFSGFSARDAEQRAAGSRQSSRLKTLLLGIRLRAGLCSEIGYLVSKCAPPAHDVVLKPRYRLRLARADWGQLIADLREHYTADIKDVVLRG